MVPYITLSGQNPCQKRVCVCVQKCDITRSGKLGRYVSLTHASQDFSPKRNSATLTSQSGGGTRGPTAAATACRCATRRRGHVWPSQIPYHTSPQPAREEAPFEATASLTPYYINNTACMLLHGVVAVCVQHTMVPSA